MPANSESFNLKFPRVGIEERISEKVLEGCRPLLGIVDLVFQSDNRLVVRDYKTAARKWNQGNAESNAGQLELYGELVKKLVPNRELSFEFIVLTKTKSPVVERFTVEAASRSNIGFQTRRSSSAAWNCTAKNGWTILDLQKASIDSASSWRKASTTGSACTNLVC